MRHMPRPELYGQGAAYFVLKSILKSQTEKDKYMISFICGIRKYDTNELIYKTETDSETQRTDLWLPKGKGGRDKLGGWD